MLSAAMSAQKVYTIPFIEDYSGELAVPVVNIDGKMFIVDSGASRSVIGAGFKENYQRLGDTELKLATINGESQYEIMRRFRVSLLGTFHPFTEQSIRAINNAYKKYKLKQDIYGIIGSDFLRAHKAVIDYDKKTLTITI